MDQLQLNPFADLYLRDYWDLALVNRAFMDEYKFPLTLAAKAHVLRSVAQAWMTESDLFQLDESYLQSGRLQFTDIGTGKTFLVRSSSSVSIEASTRQRDALFDSRPLLVSDVTMIVYKFHDAGMDLGIAATRRVQNRSRLEAVGAPFHVATWQYSSVETDVFEEGISDPFRDVGEIDESEDGTGV